MTIIYKLLAIYTFITMIASVFLNVPINGTFDVETVIGIMTYLPMILFAMWSIFKK